MEDWSKITYMAHLRPFRIISGCSIRVRKSNDKTSRALNIWTMNPHTGTLLGLRLLEDIAQGHWSAFLAVEWSYEAPWLKIIEDFVNDISLLQSASQ